MKKRLLCFWLLGVFLAILPFSAFADRNKFLDAALPYLEEGNPFMARYNELNGADLQSRWPLGCPYFWAGRSVKNVLKPVRCASESNYYKKDQFYLYGLDCAGFTQYIVQKCGYEEHPKISDLLNISKYQDKIIRGAKGNTGEERSAVLRIGDLLAIRHPSGGFHIGMYCGTLASYGYTEESLPPELAPYLGFPLLIHCTESSDYYERYRDFLAAQEEDSGILPPCGGVVVSVLDVPPSAAPSRTPDLAGLSVPCFDLEGYHLQVLDLAQEKQFRWIRWRQRPAEETSPPS